MRGLRSATQFDAHLLLTSLPTISGTNHRPCDDDEETWSDLPSDSEDTFFLTPLETQAYHRDKRFKAMDRLRAERMQALEAQEAEAERHSKTMDKDPWGDDDEEASHLSSSPLPTSQAQLDLMTRTAKHILSSPNPTQLESRILANHGMDPRFAFLRGRWKRRWDATKAKSAAPLPLPPLAARPTLVAYGSDSDSDTDSVSVNNGGGAHPQDEAPRSIESNIAASAPALNVEHGHADTNANPSLGPSEKPNSDVTANQAAKRARLREWSQKRREAKTEGAG
ncbi:hypothetical protein FRB94_014011 [Tulasnella sp. JGI-2019a]|nr:hypothetical protein FRB93_005544 [Tulasnella sp. JGI-2019a]KAG8989790.1 hypothetical protein FRB94_014011 [Tulasnella sp. JGI-2019a]